MKRPTMQGRERADHGISSPYGPRPGIGDGHHDGDDYYWVTGDPINSKACYGVAAGTVIEVFWSNSMGWCITVQINSSVRVRYCHMASVAVSVGERVTTSTYIGHMGATGTEARGETHLHLEVWVGGRRVNPAPYFAGTSGGGSKPFENGDIDMRVIYNKDAPDAQDATRRALIGELSFQVITGPQSTRERKFWGEPVNVTTGEWDAALDLVNERRKALGLPAQSGTGRSPSPDLEPVLEAIATIPAAVRGQFEKEPLR